MVNEVTIKGYKSFKDLHLKLEGLNLLIGSNGSGKSNFLSLDRAHFYYTLQAVCQNGKVTVEMTHIRYLYDEYRKPQRLKAEEWITDKEALNKKKTKLLPISGKFRRKTVDRKDVLFNNLEALLK